MARRDNSDPTGIGQTLNWAWAWPANRRVLYNRASCDPSGKPFNPQRKLIAWNGKQWGGADMPDFGPDVAPANGVGPFIMNPEGVARFFARKDMDEGPFPEHYEPFETPLGYNPLSPKNRKATSKPAARVFKGDRETFGKAAEFPHVATTYRLTEHFHYWTKHARLNAISSPSSSSRSARRWRKELGVAAGDRVKVSSKRGHIEAVAVVTKRIKPLNIEGKTVHTSASRFTGASRASTKPGYPGQHADALRGRRQHADAGVQGVPGQGREGREETAMSLQSLDIMRRSATTTPAPSQREAYAGEVAKLIDVSKCIGCKACQVACMEWNDLRDEIGTNIGVYDNPQDLTEQSWTVMRFTEYENQEGGDLEWLIRKDGCMHCEDPGCLKACPSPGAIVQYANGIVDFQEENCIGCGYCVDGLPVRRSAHLQEGQQGIQVHACAPTAWRVGLEPACVKTCPTGAIMFGTKEDMKDQAAERIEDLKERGFDKAGLYDPAGVGGTHVMYVLHHADKPSLYNGLPDDPHISPLVALWKGVTKPLALAGIALTALAGFFHYTRVGPNETTDEEEADADVQALARREDAGVQPQKHHQEARHEQG